MKKNIYCMMFKIIILFFPVQSRVMYRAQTDSLLKKVAIVSVGAALANTALIVESVQSNQCIGQCGAYGTAVALAMIISVASTYRFYHPMGTSGILPFTHDAASPRKASIARLWTRISRTA